VTAHGTTDRLPDARDIARMIPVRQLLRVLGVRVRNPKRADCPLCKGNSTGTLAFTERLWRYVDRTPRPEAISNAQRIYHRLAHLDAAQPLRFRFDGDAQALFVAWLTELERKLRSIGLHPALVSHLAKYRKLMPALALLFELADGGVENVSLEHARQSAAFCDYLESHARRIYSMIISPERQAAAELGRHLAAGWKDTEGMLTVRDVYQNDWRDLSTPDAAGRALAILQDAGWVQPAELDQRICN
jgi:putative DNA primase/helicase